MANIAGDDADVETLVGEWGALAAGDALRAVGGTARRLSRSDPSAVERLLDTLSAGDEYRRRLAVVAAHAAGRHDRLRLALDDPAPAVALAALAAGATVLADRDLLAAVVDGSVVLRRATALALRRSRRAGLADRALPVVRDRWGDVEAARVLPACSPATVRRHLPELAHVVGSWTALVRGHADPLLEWVAGTLEAAADPDARLVGWARLAAPLYALAPVRPAGVLDLVERFGVDTVPAVVTGRFTQLAGADATRLVRLLARPGRLPDHLRTSGLRPSRAARQRLAGVPHADLAALARVAPANDLLLAGLLACVPPARRPALLDAAYAGQDRSHVELPDHLLELLPRERREAEATRMMRLRWIRRDPGRSDQMAAFLPLSAATARLTPLTRRRDADQRATGYRLLLAAAGRRRDPARLTEILASLDRLRNEQDPVRSDALAALAALPPARFEAAAAPVLDGMVADALGARDRSEATTRALADLAVGLLGRGITEGIGPLRDWALTTIERLYAAGTGIAGRTLDRLPKGAERAILDRIGPRLADGLHRGRYRPVLDLAGALRRRAWPLDDLAGLVGRIATRAPQRVAVEAVALWLARPDTRTHRLDRLVDADPSVLTVRAARDAALRRPALLDRLLSGTPMDGRFATRGTSQVPLPGAARLIWSPARRAAYAKLLAGEVGDAKQHMWHRARMLDELVCVVGADAAAPYLDTGVPTELAEAALKGLGRTARPDLALPVLLGQLNSDRARVVAPALACCLRGVSPARLAATLSAVLRDVRRVTVRKEALRLAGAHRVPGAVALLESTWRDGAEHRDVRAAAARALTDHLDDEAAWRVLTEARRAGRELATTLLSTRPTDLAPTHRPRYGRLVADLVRHPDHEVRTGAMAALGDWVPEAPELADVLSAVLLDLSDSGWASARLAFDRCWHLRPRVLPDVVAGLVADSGAGPDAGPEHDRPARQRLAAVVAYRQPFARRLARHRDAALAAAEHLWTVPEHADEAVELTLSALRWDSPELPGELSGLADRMAGRPAVACAAAALLPRVVARSATAGSVDLLPAVAALASRADLAGGLLATSLLAWCGSARQWPAPAREALRGLRAHPEVEVRAAARHVWTAAE